MKRKVKELKRIARQNLQGKYLILIQAVIMCSVIVSLLEMPFSWLTNENDFSIQNIIYYGATLLISIASIVLVAGQYRMHLSVARTGKLHPSDLFYPVRYHADRFLITQFIVFGMLLVCSIPAMGAVAIIYLYEDWAMYGLALILILISIVLGAYVVLNFDLVHFVLNDHEDFSPLEAIKHTKKIVFSHRRRYLYLLLSFMGYVLLSFLSLGIASLWIEPYMLQTQILFYLDITGELSEVLEEQRKNNISPKPVAFDSYV